MKILNERGIKMKKRRSLSSLDARRQRDGYTFIIHYVIGLIMFFIIPIFNSLKYSISDVSIDGDGVKTEFVGLKYFKYILFEDSAYLDYLRDSVVSLLYSLPVIISLSLILAVVLNQNFVGRTVARGIFFLPVIIASSVVLELLTGQYVRAPFMFISSGEEYNYGSIIDFNKILSNFDLPSGILSFLSDSLTDVFSLIWSCGVQTILFLGGLQSISPSFYEVSKIEGANKWEEFWFITIPMLRHMILLVIIYTMIDLFTAVNNPVMNQAYTVMQDKQVYDRSSAMLWGYFIVVGTIIGAVTLAFNRYCKRKWE